jgi:hypothetical protein
VPPRVLTAVGEPVDDLDDTLTLQIYDDRLITCIISILALMRLVRKYRSNELTLITAGGSRNANVCTSIVIA